MNDQDVIDKLNSLKTVMPSTEALARIRSRSLSRGPRTKRHFLPFFGIRIPKFSIPAISIALATLIIFLIGSQTIAGRVILTQAKVAVESNRYNKATIALNLTNTIATPGVTNNSIKYLSSSLELTDKQLVSLRLNGEPGKYTKAQCLEEYHKYDATLTKITGIIKEESNKTSDPQKKVDLEELLNKVKQYDTAAETRIKMY